MARVAFATPISRLGTQVSGVACQSRIARRVWKLTDQQRELLSCAVAHDYRLGCRSRVETSGYLPQGFEGDRRIADAQDHITHVESIDGRTFRLQGGHQGARRGRVQSKCLRDRGCHGLRRNAEITPVHSPVRLELAGPRQPRSPPEWQTQARPTRRSGSKWLT